MGITIRPADGVCALCAAFLFGTLAASLDWSLRLLCALCVIPAVIILCAARSRAVALFILGGLIVLPISFFYYRVRVSGFSESAVPSNSPALLSPLYPALDAALPEREASLLEGMFFGSTSALVPDVKAWMSAAGTSYLLGMYGYKIHILWESVLWAAARIVPRYAAMIFSLAAVAAFVAFAGSPLSAIRAGTMVAFASLAELFGRPFAKRNALVFAATGIVALAPSVWRGASFALSFMSLAGIYLLAPRFKAVLPGKGRGLFGWRSHLSVSAGINLAILPVAAASYGSFPLVSFISNFFSSIAFGATLVLGMVCALSGTIVPSSAILIAPPLRILLSYELAVSRLLASVPLAIPGMIFVPFVAVLYYLALGFWISRTE